jgi:hypothetical protein
MAQTEQSTAQQDLPDTQRNVRLSRVAAIIVGALGILTTISPLFGKKGIASVIPLPDRLNGVGRALITGISLALVLVTGAVLWSGRPSRRKTWLGVVMLLAALSMLAVYMSWITSTGVSPPSMWRLDGDVVAVLVIGFSIALFAVSLVVFANQLVVVSSGTLDLALLQETRKLATREASQTGSAMSLLNLMLTANWTRIERESRSHRSPYWRLFGAISRIIVNPRQEAKDIRKVRFWARAIAIIELFRFGKATERKSLLALAEGFVPWLTIRNETWREVDKLCASPKDSGAAFNAYLSRFMCAYHGAPDYIGYARVIEDTGHTLSELLAFKESTPPISRLEISNMMRGAVARQALNTLGKIGVEKSILEIDESVLSAISTDDRRRMATAAYKAAQDFHKVREAYPEKSDAWFLASNYVSIAYCLAIAADQEEASVRKLEALAYVGDQSCERLHVDAKEVAEKLIGVNRTIHERGVEVSAELQEKVETVMQKINRLLPSLLTNPA